MILPGHARQSGGWLQACETVTCLFHLTLDSKINAGRTRRLMSDALARPEAGRRKLRQRGALSDGRSSCYWLMGSEQLLPELMDTVVRRLVNEHMSVLIEAE